MSRLTRLTMLFAGLFLAFSVVAADYADARRGGSFGSRGSRTFQSAPPTRTAPQPPGQVERSMTPQPAPGATMRQDQTARSPGFLNGMSGSLMRGLVLGGLIGLLLGHGFGGMAGMFGFLLQALLIGGGILLLIRMFRSQPSRAPSLAGAGTSFDTRTFEDAGQRKQSGFSLLGGIGSNAEPVTALAQDEDIGLEQSDLDTFEKALTDLQTAFGREDHAALRKVATPEMVSYLSEELAENAKSGVRNDVSDVKLLQADIAESWREGDKDYATAAMLYSSRDVTRDRANGQIVDGLDEPTETTELWTFVRPNGADWKVSAIQSPAA